jgi:hypothetical protein
MRRWWTWYDRSLASRGKEEIVGAVLGSFYARKAMMAQGKRQQSQDSYAQRGKSLTSRVQRLRGWVGSDPSRAAELADALVELTEHRLSGHGYAAAAQDAQEAVRRAAELLAAKGPIGPYTSLSDAARYVTAAVHLATIQAGLGRSDAAGRTIESLRNIQDQLGDGLLRQLQPQTAIWGLLCSARAALASGEVATANAYADAAIGRMYESHLGDEPDEQYLAMDVDRLVSDCRWRAGRLDQSIMFLHAAKTRYDNVVGGRLHEPGRLTPALLERLAEPLFGLYREMADRLLAIGEVDLGLVTRRTLIDLLRGLTGRLSGDLPRVQLATALSDLARDLTKAGRGEEADAAAADAAATGLEPLPAAVQDPAGKDESMRTQPMTWTTLPPTALFAATTAGAGGTVALTSLLAERQRKTSAWLQAERVPAHRLELGRMERAQVETKRREVERANAERAAAAQLAAERVQAEDAERREAERRAAAEEAQRLDRKRRREERLEAHRLEVERREAERREAERVEAERSELERLQAEIDELER